MHEHPHNSSETEKEATRSQDLSGELKSLTSSYRYEDFLRDWRELDRRRMEDCRSDLSAFFRNGGRILRFFEEFYEPREALKHSWTYLNAKEHVEMHSADYGMYPFGEIEGDTLYHTEALTRALHWYFGVLPVEDRNSDTSVERIKNWAIEWLESQS